MSPAGAWAIALGLTLGLGLWSLVSLVPRLARPGLTNRVAPYLVDVSDGARAYVEHRPSNPLPVLGTMLGPLAGRVRALLAPLLGGPAVVAERLRQSGSELSVDAFRARQLAWAIGGAAVGVLLSFALARTQPLPVVVHLGLVVVLCVAGFVARDYLLQRAARSRLARMAGELPVVLEFLTLSLSAGEGILDSIRRIAKTSGGELAAELGSVVTAVNSGSPLAESLKQMADGIRLPALTRCVAQVTGALERGTPLADVLRAQAQDVREEAKRDLLELAGKKEVAMMVPLVFMILPVTILFAVFPGIYVLQLGF
ncbi:type II secretion system F family protein [Leifsonella bigeumensis]|uniref:type II secretion system F family protein n=1 Tax=Leifsonella bigeumensis TaxID=433643 RepID=UPI0031CFC7F6